MITARQYSSGVYSVVYGGIPIGNVLMDADGYYYFYPDVGDGAFGQNVLREIATFLESLNGEHEAKANNN